MTARPKIGKIVDVLPLFAYYKPQGIPMTKLDVINLTLEEVEALKLKDKDNLNQTEAAKKMGISRSTFQRLLRSGREKMVKAILEGKALKVEGGNYIPNENIIKTKCLKGSYHFFIKKGNLKSKEEKYKISKIKCPECGKRLIDFE